MNVISTLIRAFAPWMDQARDYMFRRAAPTVALGPLMQVLYNYLGRAVRRLDALVLKWERGQLPVRRAPAAPRRAAQAGSAPSKPRLPTRPNWLRDCHAPFGLYAAGVERLLEDPDTRALLAAAPQAGRILRPLARMFGVAVPEWLRLPRRKRKPRALKPRKPREDLSDLRPIALRFIPPKDRARLRRLGMRFKSDTELPGDLRLISLRFMNK